MKNNNIIINYCNLKETFNHNFFFLLFVNFKEGKRLKNNPIHFIVGNVLTFDIFFFLVTGE